MERFPTNGTGYTRLSAQDSSCKLGSLHAWNHNALLTKDAEYRSFCAVKVKDWSRIFDESLSAEDTAPQTSHSNFGFMLVYGVPAYWTDLSAPSSHMSCR